MDRKHCKTIRITGSVTRVLENKIIFDEIAHKVMMKLLIILPLLSISFAVFAKKKCSESVMHFEYCQSHSNEMLQYYDGKCSKALIKDYTSELFEPLNNHLRGIKIDYTCDQYSDDLYFEIENLRKAPESNFYRGVRSIDYMGSLQIGDCFVDKGYLSFTTKESVAESFTNPSNFYILILKTKNAREVGESSNYSQEKEVIVLPNSYLRLKKREKFEIIVEEFSRGRSVKNFGTKLHFEEVSHSECGNL